MCGIVGYVGEKESVPVLIEGLRRLEYRGYDSAGVAVLDPAPGGKLRADESRRTDCVFAHGGSVFGCNGAKRKLESRPGILWYEVRVSDGALLQEGFVDDPACDYLNPSLAVDRDGFSAIALNRFDHSGSCVGVLRVRDGHARSIRGQTFRDRCGSWDPNDRLGWHSAFRRRVAALECQTWLSLNYLQLYRAARNLA